MNKFFKSICLLLSVILIATVFSATVTVSADTENTKIVWDFDNAVTEDIMTWVDPEFALSFWAGLNLEDFSIENKMLKVNLVGPQSPITNNTVQFLINPDIPAEEKASYTAFGLYVDMSAIEGEPEIRVNAQVMKSRKYCGWDFENNKGMPVEIYVQNGPKYITETFTDINLDGSVWPRIKLPENFKGYIKMPFESMNISDGGLRNCNPPKGADIGPGLEMFLEFTNDAVEGNNKDGKSIYIDNIQVIKGDAAPEGWVPGELLKGDVNFDGKVSTRDALHILEHLSERREFTDIQEAAADVNNDQKVTTVDVLKILAFIAERIEEL